MKQQVYEIDANGFIKEIYVAVVDEQGNILDKGMKTFISSPLPNGLFKARWTGTKWVEGATQTEIDESTRAEPIPPTMEERIAALEEALLMIMEG